MQGIKSTSPFGASCGRRQIAKRTARTIACLAATISVVSVSYRIQLICSQREEAAALRAMLPPSFSFPSQLLPDNDITLSIEELVLDKSWDVDFRHSRADLGIILMDTGSTTGFMAQSGVMRDNVASILFLTSDGNPPPNWQMRHRRDAILARPVSEHSLRAVIERIVIEANRILPDQIAEHHLLAFMTHLIERGNRIIQPTLQPNRPSGFLYPLFESYFGQLVDPIALGEHLSSLGLVKKTIIERQRLCPVCGSPHLVYREVCPRCSSRDYDSFDGIHHITCGYTGDRRAFLRSSALICPHCNRTLDQEGRDFTRPNEGLRCGSCSFTFETPEVVAHCQHCGSDGQPSETEEQLLPQYELLPQADEAALIRRIGVADIIGSIRSQHTGLFTRQYSEYELR
jgi:hypothetical protein